MRSVVEVLFFVRLSTCWGGIDRTCFSDDDNLTDWRPSDVGKEERTRRVQHRRLPHQVRVHPGAAGPLQKKSRRLLGRATTAIPTLLLRIGGGFTGHPLQWF